MVRKRYFTDFFKNPRQLGMLLVRITRENYSSLLKEKEVLPRLIVREICSFIYKEPCHQHRAEYVRNFIRNNRLPMIEFLQNNDINDDDPYEAIARRFHVLVDEWEGAGRSKSGKDPQRLKFSREVRGNIADIENNAGLGGSEEEENAEMGVERVEDRDEEHEGNDLTSGIEDQGDERVAAVVKQGIERESEQESRERMDKESDMDGGESRMGERAEEREDGIIEDVGQQELGSEGLELGQNEVNIEPSTKKRRKRRSPEEMAMEDYEKFCSPRYMEVAMNK